ncbi:hypothetical protein [Reinekea marinisedimentorum]|uniref:Uncharacterized protein n=1 Tax=Reinekea marinisedimentorum TaxID=230495 RepID=A0A4R3ICW8_9GAMM|nr:hypothetical protein [Reinekea marinisedimentorum]TCS43267.1 hypothetical protein BCF53_102293 [Reinekea marinisedimentorum]
MIRLYEAYLVFVGVIWLGSLTELNGGGLWPLNLAASCAYLSIILLELIRRKRRRWFNVGVILSGVVIAGVALVDYFMAPAEVYLHWLDLAVLSLGLLIILLRFYLFRSLTF